MRLLAWTGEVPPAGGQLPVTGRKEADESVWLQVVRDAEADARGWLLLEDAGGRKPGLEYESLESWLRRTGHLRRPPGRTSGVSLRGSPSPTAAVISSWLPEAPGTRLRFLGIQGAWLRAEIETEACASEFEDPADEPRSRRRKPCSAGWTPWRAASGGLLLFPD